MIFLLVSLTHLKKVNQDLRQTFSLYKFNSDSNTQDWTNYLDLRGNNITKIYFNAIGRWRWSGRVSCRTCEEFEWQKHYAESEIAFIDYCLLVSVKTYDILQEIIEQYVNKLLWKLVMNIFFTGPKFGKQWLYMNFFKYNCFLMLP